MVSECGIGLIVKKIVVKKTSDVAFLRDKEVAVEGNSPVLGFFLIKI